MKASKHITGFESLALPLEDIQEVCRRWGVRELSLFGSTLTKRRGPHSDVDLMVDFDAERPHTLLDVAALKEELETILGRRVDLVGRKGIERSRNAVRRRSILSSARVLYAA